MKKEKEIITVTCPKCHQKSTIEVKFTNLSLYHGVCPKCITEEGFHVDFFIDTYQMKEIKEREVQEKKCRKENENHLKAIAINPNNAEAYNHLGINYHYLEQYQQAIDSYQRAIELDPNAISAVLPIKVVFILPVESSMIIGTTKRFCGMTSPCSTHWPSASPNSADFFPQ